MGRLNDYKLSYLTDLHTLRDVIAAGDPTVTQRIDCYVTYCRREQPVLAHALSHPQVDRRLAAADNGAVRIVARDDDTITLSGARAVATLAPLANELLILPFGVYTAEQCDLALLCALPIAQPGLTLHVRPLDADPADPLAAFDEPDALVRFDRVCVPRERVFLAGDAATASQLFAHAAPLAYFAAQTRLLVKLEFFGAVARAVLQAIGAAEFAHNKVALGDIAAELIVARSLLDSAAACGRYDTTRRSFMPSMPHVWGGLLQGASLGRRLGRLISENAGCGVLMRTDPAAVEDEAEAASLEAFCRGENISGGAKAALFRLAWSLSSGPIGTRQTMFDTFAFGDPFALRAFLGLNYDWSDGLKSVQRALDAAPGPAARRRRRADV
jgi:4-hydroxyphenylacetate 3-monooxygenase